MPNVVQSTRIPMNAVALWRETGAFGAVGDWHPMLEDVDSEGDVAGATRTARAADGSTQVERLRAFDANRHVYHYTMESTALPVRDYVGEFRIDDNGDGTSTVTWSARFDVSEGVDDEVVEMIGGFLKAGIHNLEHRYGEN